MPPQSIRDQFRADLQALAMACRRVSDGVVKTDDPHRTFAAAQLSEVAATLSTAQPWSVQAEAAASLRSLFHRDGIDDQPPPPDWPNWEADLALIWSLSTIHAESRYRELVPASEAALPVKQS
jgi:hypothetical protein